MEGQGEDNNALQVIELRRQLQEKDRAIESLEQERDEEHQRREHNHERDREQLEAQEEEIGRLRQQLYHLQTRPLTTRQVQVEAPAVTTVQQSSCRPRCLLFGIHADSQARQIRRQDINCTVVVAVHDILITTKSI